VRSYVENPNLGKEKRRDLSGVFVYKFKFHTREFLLGYTWHLQSRLLLALGVHENFYPGLKKE
jgi:hypothetical protein